MQEQTTEVGLGSLIAGIVGVLLLLAAITSIRVVGTGQVGVVTRFGQPVAEWDEGVHVKLPYGIERVRKFDVKVQREDAEAAAATADLQDVSAKLAVNYHLERDKVGQLYKSIGADYKLRVIEPAIQESFKQVAPAYTLSEMIQKRPEVKVKTQEVLRNRLAKYGIIIDDVSLTNFTFSKEVSEAIEDKQVAQQQAERAQYNLERAKIDAEAQNVQKSSLSPELLEKLRIEAQVKAIDKWKGNMPQYLGGGSVFNIPLIK